MSEGSILIGKIFPFIKKAYNLSILYYLISAFNEAYKKSISRKSLRHYINRTAYFKYSITYRIFGKISIILSFLLKYVYRFFHWISSGSFLLYKIKNIPKTNGSIILIYCGFFTALTDLSYIGATLFTAPIESINVPASLALIIFSVLCMIIGNILNWIKNSFIFKFAAYFFKD